MKTQTRVYINDHSLKTKTRVYRYMTMETETRV